MAGKESKARFVISAVDDATATIRRVKKNVEGMTAPVARMRKSFRAFSKQSGLQDLGRNAMVMGRRVAVATGVVGGAVGFLTAQYADNATEVSRWAGRLGLSNKALSRALFVGKQFGVQQDAMIDGFKELSLRADEFAISGGGQGEEAFKRLGLSKAQINEARGDTEQLFELVTGQLRKVKNVAARQRIVDELFGGQAGEQLAQMVSASAGEIERLKQRADDLNVTIGKDAGQASEEYARALSESQAAAEGLRNTFAARLLPQLTRGMRSLSDWVANNQAKIAGWANTFSTEVVPTVWVAMKGLAAFAGQMGEIVGGLADFLGGFDNLAIAVATLFSAKLITGLAQVALSLGTLGATLIPMVVAGLKAMAAAALANPIIALVGVIAAAGAMIITGWNPIREWFPETWDIIVNSLGKAIAQMIAWFEAIPQRIRSAFDLATGYISKKVGALKGLVPDWMRDMASGAASVYQGAKEVAGFSSPQAQPATRAPQTPETQQAPQPTRALNTRKSRQEFSGKLRVTIDSEGRPKVKEMRSDHPGIDMEADSGMVVASVY